MDAVMWKCKAISRLTKRPAGRGLLSDSSGTHRISRRLLPVKRDVAFNYLESREQIAVKVWWQSVNGDSGLLIVAAVSELMPNRLGQVSLVDFAALHGRITAHMLSQTSSLEHLESV